MEESIRQQLLKEKVGFITKKRLASEFTKSYTPEVSLKKALEYYQSENYQIKMYAIFILGNIAHQEPKALPFLKETVSTDANWRVQEILAMAFAEYFQNMGYTKALPVMNEWLNDGRQNLRRAVTEGLRPWNKLDHYRDNPTEAIILLSHYKDDTSEYVRKSAGNALKDIAKEYPELVLAEVSQWDVSDRKIKQTYQHAMRLLDCKK